MNLKEQSKSKKQGFSLIEVLLTLIVLSSSLAVIFAGFDISSKLNNYAAFESEAAFLAEREIELAKSELLNGNLKAGKLRKLSCRFKLKPGWKLVTLLLPPDEENIVRLQVRVNNADRELQLESFLFLPDWRVNSNG